MDNRHWADERADEAETQVEHLKDLIRDVYTHDEGEDLGEMGSALETLYAAIGLEGK